MSPAVLDTPNVALRARLNVQERGLQRRAIASATDNATVSDFLDWLLPKLNGFGGAGGGGAAVDGDAAAAADGGGYASPDYSYSGSDGEDGEDVESGRAAMAGSEDEAEAASGSEDDEMAEAGDSGGCCCSASAARHVGSCLVQVAECGSCGG